MSMFDDMIVNARSAADAVGKKASKLVDLSKLRISAADINGEINKKFQSLGRSVYDAHKAGADPSETISSTSAEVNDLMEQLEAVNMQLAAAHAKIVCGYCGEENSQEAIYCSKCGHRLFEDKAEKTAPGDSEQGGNAAPADNVKTEK